MPDADAIQEAVREHYAAAARTAGGCCGPGQTVVGPDEADVFGRACYDPTELEALPAEAVTASIGCANPVALAELAPGEVVLDLGSGGGIDVLLSARRVGPAGHAFGLDMTDEMLELAEANRAKAGVDNVTFLRGQIENVPLPDRSVDVVTSNCVINLSTDKDAVFAEAYRVLCPRGRLCVADVVADGEVAPSVVDLDAWAGCLAGAVSRPAYTAALGAAGFVDISITDSHPVAEGFTSVLVRARRPAS